MGLRARLALFFIAITVVPTTVAVLVLQAQVATQLQRRTDAQLDSAQAAAAAVLTAVRERVGDVADDLASPEAAAVLAAGDEAAAERWLDAESARALPRRASFTLLTDPAGALVASTVTAADFTATAPDVAAVAAAAVRRSAPADALVEVRELRASAPGEPVERTVGYVVAGVWLDVALLDRLAAVHGAAFVADGRVLAARSDGGAVRVPEVAPGAGVVTATAAGTRVRAAALTVDGLPGAEARSLVLWVPLEVASGGRALLLLPVLVVAVLAAGLIAWYLAGSVVAPIRRAADVARAVAAGDLSRSLEPSGGPELGELAVALNTMSEQLRGRLAELEDSRDELRRSLARLGQTLSSSLDLNRTLSVVVETAMDTLAAEQALLYLLTPERDALYAKVGRGAGDRIPRVPLGAGRVGRVAQTAMPLHLPDADAPAPAPGEPAARHQLAVPMLGRGRVIGVLTLLRDEAPFSVDELETIRSFASQASVAIENVLLHQEAQRLSVTDPLTGLWNFRYFQLQADRELESAARFDRPVSLVILDLDHFKDVNDRYGHQIGDEVLVEVARRVRDSTRVPDVVARYGGEEFVVLLPGTGLEGALATAERIRFAVGGTPIETSAASGSVRALTVTCSAGVATFPRFGRTVAGLLRSADAAMYTAKSRGRNRVVVAGSSGVVALDGGAGTARAD